MSTPTLTDFSVIQTFYIDSAALNYAATVGLTSIGLWFKAKPDVSGNLSGTQKPGVTIWLCEVEADQPILSRIVPGSQSRLEYDYISPFADAKSGSFFRFSGTVSLSTDKFYGIVVKYDDPDFVLWTNKTGDKLVSTNIKSTGQAGWIGSKTWDGKYFQGNATGKLIAISDTDLKFSIIAGKYSSNSITIEVLNKDYEFLTVNNYVGTFMGGEKVYQNSVSSSNGTISIKASNATIIGTNTNFTSILLNSYIVAQNGSNVDILLVDNVVNTTALSVSTLPSFTNAISTYKVAPVATVYQVDRISKKVKLVDSKANSTVKFLASNTIFGAISNATCTIVSIDDQIVDTFVPYFKIDVPAAGQVSVQYKLCYDNGSAYVMPASYQTMIPNVSNKVSGYKGVIKSRSLEVAAAQLYGTTRKSAVQTITMTMNQSNTSLYESPRFNVGDIDISIKRNMISNAYTVTTGGVVFDTEVGKNGTALSKHISRKVGFANNRFAEDLKVFMTAYRPPNTDIKVYAKIHNSGDSDAFDDKSWTPLTCYENGNAFSSSIDATNLIEYTYGLPKYSDTANTLPGTFATTLSNNVLVASGVSPNTYVRANDAVKIYSPLIPENYMVGIVTAANTSTITIGELISNNNVVGTGFVVDKLKYPNIAFINPLNFKICKYYDTAYGEQDKFDAMQVKVVLLADNSNIVPKVDQLQVVGVSA
jgi:hypothetical protein